METQLDGDRDIESRLLEWDAVIERLMSRAGKVGPESKIEYLKLIAALRKKRDLTRRRLVALHGSTGERALAGQSGVQTRNKTLKAFATNG